MLRIMEKKGLVEFRVERRAFIYTARYSRDDSASGFLDRVFDGAASQMVLSLLRAERIPPEELDRVRAMIDAAFSLSEVSVIEASVQVGNPASLRVLEKVGFAHVGTGLRGAPARGAMIECEAFEFKRADWTARDCAEVA